MAQRRSKLTQGHIKRTSRDLNSEPLTHTALDWLLEPSLVSPDRRNTPRVGLPPGFSCLPPSQHPAWALHSAWQVPNQYRFNQEIRMPQDNFMLKDHPLPPSEWGIWWPHHVTLGKSLTSTGLGPQLIIIIKRTPRSESRLKKKKKKSLPPPSVKISILPFDCYLKFKIG